MGRVKIIADSTCDLSDELLHKYDIGIIPLMINMGNNSFKDRIEITPKEIYEWSNRSGETPKTAAPTIGDAIDYLSPFVEDKDDIIFIGISEAMSVTCNVIRMAAESLNYSRLFIFDSKNLSTGIGLQVMKAAELALLGSTAEEIIEEIQLIQDKVRASFVIDTLTYLYRGGRCSAVTALLANTLKLKPKIIVVNGKMDVEKKYRGHQNAVVVKYVKDMEQNLKDADPARVFITHSECPDDLVAAVYDYLENLSIFREIIITKAGSVISSHCGPNTLGVLYISK
ncbi:MAG: hypothetical protein K0S47_915 [Herbinix sp.]|jgi:DegV family protein with EDD domain|nr:hypothetical protein [Herbinix sp.]